MRSRFLLAACCFGAASFSATSAFGQIGAPQLGWIPDGARIRPVNGLPAAAAVGAPVPADQDFAQIAASPARNYVLVSAADTGIVSLYTTERGLVALDGAGAAPDSIVLSPRGSSAALWFSSLSRLQIVTGLPETPVIRQLDTSFLGTAPAALAISDDGAWAAGIWTAGTYTLGPSGEVNLLPVDNAATLAFFAGTHNLAVASASAVQMITGVEGFALTSNLLTSADASLQPIGIAATSDNRTLILADHSGSVTAIDISSGASTLSDCGCQPSGLFGMGPSAFRLTGLEGGGFKLFDAALGEVLIAPLAWTETEGAGQ